MTNYPNQITDIEQLEDLLSLPTPELVQMMKHIDGDFMFLGVAGKMGVSMARMAKRACDEAKVKKRVIGVSRFSDAAQLSFLNESGIETIKGDLLDLTFINSLPNVKNIIYLAGMKFGSVGNEPFTWAMNSFLPGLVVERFKDSRIVALSTGCVYPLVNVDSGGSRETDAPLPIGEYAQSCLGRERLFEYGSQQYGTSVALIRLNYAVEMRYGVLVDIATKVFHGKTIDLTMGYANVLWQGDANDMILRSFGLCRAPAEHINISGAELVSVAKVAEQFGKLMSKKVSFSGKEAESALLVNVAKGHYLLGTPKIKLDRVLKWTADWVMNNRYLLGKATHFEVRDGKY